MIILYSSEHRSVLRTEFLRRPESWSIALSDASNIIGDFFGTGSGAFSVSLIVGVNQDGCAICLICASTIHKLFRSVFRFYWKCLTTFELKLEIHILVCETVL